MTTHVVTATDGERTSAMPRMENLVQGFDWAATSLGAHDAWPQSLRTTVDNMLASGHAMCVIWGPERILLYNDAYAPVLGKRHPAALGMPTAAVWPELWDDIKLLVDRGRKLRVSGPAAPNDSQGLRGGDVVGLRLFTGP